ncbi:dual serine/threonine and tyrosine protein kinase [Protopterus annectens]|uniref:dual serine/threonine and tyrosine protein kinase n=1 Tax=Protopterus annectens TaxID=7888 RepID=UPI001CFB340E|nr:dual serine/threonine and tyrosine protein kinase [Protopterus annectens]
MEGCAGGGGGQQRLNKDLNRAFAFFVKYSTLLRQNLKDSVKFFSEIKAASKQHQYCNSCAPSTPTGKTQADLVAEAAVAAAIETGPLSGIAFFSDEAEQLQSSIDCHPRLFIFGQNWNAKCHVVNSLLGQLLPSVDQSEDENCRKRKLRFTYGKQMQISLIVLGQYELVPQRPLVSHQGKWDTIPEEDLDIQSADDQAHQFAELEVTLPHSILQEADIVVAPSREIQSADCLLEDCIKQNCAKQDYTKHYLPIIIYAISKDKLSELEENELRNMRYKDSPVFFVKVPPVCSEIDIKVCKSVRTDQEKSDLFYHLANLGFLNSNYCSCGAPGLDNKAPSMLVEQFEKFRQLSTFARQVMQMHLVGIATALNKVHWRCLEIFINQAYYMQRDLQITPKRLEYTREKENELFLSLMSIANRKQEEMKEMIVDTLSSMKEELLDDAANLEFQDVIIGENGEPVNSKDVKRCIKQIQELIVCRLNQAVASKLISSVDYLRESFVGTLERCLKSLEKSNPDSAASASYTSSHLKQILNAAYHVEVTFHSGSTVTRMVWEQIRQIIQRITWVSPPAISTEWKRQVAEEAIESLSASRLAKNICSQFRTRLNSSHEAFTASLKQLEAGHSGRLERTENLWLKVRKDHAPRLARLSLESISLRDLLLYGKPRLGRELGRGQYGVVYLCDMWGGHSPCALKSVVPPDDKHWNDLALEFHYTRSLPKHERLIDLHGSVIDYNYGGGSSTAVLLIMERLHRDLYSGLKGGLSLELRLQIALDVVEGIRFLHSQGLVHRDIKLKNVLLDKQNRAKITDLGFCKPEAMMSGSIVGTPIHMAPELFTGKYDNSVDVYAFGILFWYLCTGSVRLPDAFEKCASKDQLWNNVKKGCRPERLPKFDEECWQLMEACWNGDPSKRPLLGIVQPMLESIKDRLCRSDSEQTRKELEDSL